MLLDFQYNWKANVKDISLKNPDENFKNPTPPSFRTAQSAQHYDIIPEQTLRNWIHQLLVHMPQHHSLLLKLSCLLQCNHCPTSHGLLKLSFQKHSVEDCKLHTQGTAQNIMM